MVDGGKAVARVAAAMVMEGEEKIRVRVLGDEDDDVAAFHWTACWCKDCCHVACFGWLILRGGDCHMA